MKPTNPLARTITLLAFILCTCTLAGIAGAEHVVAPSGAEFVSIQDAIDWSPDGETIKVESGIYLENIRLTKKITLTGVDTGGGAPVISPDTRDPVIVTLADGCTIEGLSIQNNDQASGILLSSDNNIVRKNSLHDNARGISLVSSHKNTIRSNEVIGNNKAGLILEDSTGNVIEENVFEKNALGISLDEYSLSNTITRNNFLNNQNVLSKSATSAWNSVTPFTYTYLGQNKESRMGNYWSDYHGRDANRDGIGETPYVISLGANRKALIESDQNIVDAYPLMDPTEYYGNVRPVTSVNPSPTPIISPVITIAPVVTSVVPTKTAVITPTPTVANPPEPRTWPALSLSTIVLILTGGVLVIAGGVYLTGRHRTARGSWGQKPKHVVTKAASVLKSAVERTRSLVTIPSFKTILSDREDEPPQQSVTDQKNYFPRELENKYTDITFVGRGGIAWVFSAIRKTDGTKVAVKIPISFDEVTGKCFLNEIAAWETLRHENIVEVTAVNILPVPYVEMEFVPGSLEALEKPLPVWKAVHLITGVVDGLRYAHEHGFIHRDIKPHNILLTADMVPKITDWGMSKVLAADVKKSSVAGFSLSYAAPEQVSPSEFGRTGERTDLYQLGVVFYELVTGSIPFGGESIVEVGNAILRESPTPPSEYNPDARAVEKIILKCLEKDPSLRYQSAAELLAALHGYLDEDEE
jgi:parallel beta-helix repeat protein